MAERKAPVWVRAARVHREKGPGAVWFGALSLLGYRRLVLLERRLDEPVHTCAARVETEIRELRPEDDAAFAALGQGDAELFRRRLGLGHRCWGAWVSGGLRHFGWLAFGEARVEYLRCRVLLDGGVVYAYHAYTDPSWRNVGLSAARQSLVLARLREERLEAALAAVVPENRSAAPPCLKVGYRRAGVVRAFGRGPRPVIYARLERGRRGAAGFTFARALREPTAEAPPVVPGSRG